MSADGDRSPPASPHSTTNRPANCHRIVNFLLWPHDADRSEGAAGGEATGESFVRREEFGVEFKGAGTADGRGKGGGRAEADGAAPGGGRYATVGGADAVFVISRRTAADFTAPLAE